MCNDIVVFLCLKKIFILLPSMMHFGHIDDVKIHSVVIYSNKQNFVNVNFFNDDPYLLKEEDST